MAESPEWLAERLRTEGEKSLDFFRALTRQQWEAIIYTEGTDWSIRVLLSHFVSTELAFQTLIQDVLSGGAGAPEDFDIDQFNEKNALEMRSLDHDELLERFAQARQASIDLVEQMQPADFQRLGRHPFLGVIPLEDILKLLYRHNQIHQRDVRKMLFSSGAEEQQVNR
jgi:hypothetical protein